MRLAAFLGFVKVTKLNHPEGLYLSRIKIKKRNVMNYGKESFESIIC